MNSKKKIQSYLNIIKKIEKVRSRNNNNWMELYRLAFDLAPEKAIKIIKKILVEDRKITKLTKKLSNK